MRPGWWLAAVGMAVCASVLAQNGPSVADAFKSGKDFANGSNGAQAAKGSLTPATGAATVPLYNTNPSESGIYGGGRSLIGGAGDDKKAACVGHVAGNAYTQQECDAVNYLNRMPAERVRFSIDPAADPLMVSSRGTIANPGTVPTKGVSVCHAETKVVPGTTRIETCEESAALEHIACSKTLQPRCSHGPAPTCQAVWDDRCAPLRTALKR